MKNAARRLGSYLFVIVCVALFATSCKRKPPKPGTTCSEEGTFVCDANGLGRAICHGGKWAIESCDSCQQTSSGPGGCLGKSTSSMFVGCIGRGVGPVGTECNGESFDCDGTDFVKCAAGASSKWERFACHGPQGCKRAPRGIECDHTIANVGEPCFSKESIGCSADHKTQLGCVGGVWTYTKTCGGPKGCTAEFSHDETTTHCDNTFAPAGDPCKPSTGACSLDKQSLLLCKDGKLAVSQRCRGGECGFVNETTLNCAHPGLAEVGDPCTAGSNACRPDGKAFLECKNGAFASKQSCRTCNEAAGRVTCHF